LLTINYSFFVQLAVFLALVLFLQKFLFKPLMKLWEEREDQIGGNKKRAEELSIKADQLIVYYEAQIWATRRLAQEDSELARRASVKGLEESVLKVRNESTEAIADLRERIAGEFKAAEQRVLDSAQSMGEMIVERILGKAAE